MAGITVTPKGLIKKLVGESLTIQVQFPTQDRFDVEVWSNINGTDQWHTANNLPEGYTLTFFLRQSGFFQWHLRFRKSGTKRWRQYSDSNNNKIISMVQVDPSWVSQAIVYSIFVRFFKGKVLTDDVVRQPAAREIHSLESEELKQKRIIDASIRPGEGGTFDDVKAYLKELRKLHVNVLYFNPIHLIGEMYRGYNMLDQLPDYLQPGSPYSIKDYKSIDPELTYDKDTGRHLLSDPAQEFRDLIHSAHDLGMFVVMDLVFNHTAHDFVLQRIKPEWFLYKEHINSVSDPYLYPEDLKDGKPWGDPKHTLAPYDHDVWWEDCAQLNWEYKLTPGPNDPPPNYSLREMWEYFRSIPKYWIRHFGVDGFRCDVAYRVPPRFWKECISEARQEAKRTKTNLSHDVIFIGESYTSDLRELQEVGFTAVYGDFSHKLSKPVVLKGYLDYIYNRSGQHFPVNSRWLHFPDSHDFDRAPRKVLGEHELDLHKATLANQSRWLLTATLPGIPLIFNGFEKIEWQPINIWSYGAVNWEKEVDLKQYIALINNIRRHSPALQKGSYTYLETNQGLDDHTQLFAFLREFNDEKMIVVVNMDVHKSAGPAEIYLPESFIGTYVLRDLLTGTNYKREGRNLIVILPPGAGHIFTVI